MNEKVEQISKEIMKLSKETKVDFNEYFKKYAIEEHDKLKCYSAVMKNLYGLLIAETQFDNTVVGLPYNIPHIKK